MKTFSKIKIYLILEIQIQIIRPATFVYPKYFPPKKVTNFIFDLQHQYFPDEMLNQDNFKFKFETSNLFPE